PGSNASLPFRSTSLNATMLPCGAGPFAANVTFGSTAPVTAARIHRVVPSSQVASAPPASATGLTFVALAALVALETVVGLAAPATLAALVALETLAPLLYGSVTNNGVLWSLPPREALSSR